MKEPYYEYCKNHELRIKSYRNTVLLKESIIFAKWNDNRQMAMSTRHSLFSLRNLALFAVMWFTAMVLSCAYFDIIGGQSPFDGNYHLENFVLDGLSMMVFIGVSLTLNHILIRIFHPLEHYLGKLLVYSLLLLAANTIMALVYTSIDGIPQQDSSKSIYVFSLIATFVSSIHANWIFQQSYRKEAERRNRLQMEMVRQKELSLETSLMALRSQVDPHFLFNNLSLLDDLIDCDTDSAHRFLDCLSKVYRYKLVNMNVHLVSVEDEMRMLRAYIALVSTRFGDAVRVILPAEALLGSIPPLSLQLLVENAIKHNAHSKSHPLTITVSCDEASITVTNLLQPLAPSPASTGVGLRNLRDRYALLAHQDITIHNDGTTYAVTIPIIHSTTKL